MYIIYIYIIHVHVIIYNHLHVHHIYIHVHVHILIHIHVHVHIHMHHASYASYKNIERRREGETREKSSMCPHVPERASLWKNKGNGLCDLVFSGPSAFEWCLRGGGRHGCLGWRMDTCVWLCLLCAALIVMLSLIRRVKTIQCSPLPFTILLQRIVLVGGRRQEHFLPKVFGDFSQRLHSFGGK